MKRHYFISDDLDELDRVEAELESEGMDKPQIHVYSEDDTGVETHAHLHNMEAVLKKDVVHGTVMGSLIGVAAAALVLLIAWLSGLPQTVTWVPFIFLAIVALGFCTWEGGLFGIQEMHHDFKQFRDELKAGKHVLFVDIEPNQVAALQRVIARHPDVKNAGTGSATPGFVIKAQRKWKEFVHTMP